jgi:hypothetical protein
VKVINRTTCTIDYRSRRHFGLRVWKDRCQIIAPVGREWAGVGPQLALPLEVPYSTEHFHAKEDAPNAIRVTVIRYDLEQPGSDLRAVLTKEKTFEQALAAA